MEQFFKRYAPLLLNFYGSIWANFIYIKQTKFTFFLFQKRLVNLGENVIGHGQQQQILAVGENAPQIDFDGKGILFVIRILKKRIRSVDSMSRYILTNNK